MKGGERRRGEGRGRKGRRRVEDGRGGEGEGRGGPCLPTSKNVPPPLFMRISIAHCSLDLIGTVSRKLAAGLRRQFCYCVCCPLTIDCLLLLLLLLLRWNVTLIDSQSLMCCLETRMASVHRPIRHQHRCSQCTRIYFLLIGIFQMNLG